MGKYKDLDVVPLVFPLHSDPAGALDYSEGQGGGERKNKADKQQKKSRS